MKIRYLMLATMLLSTPTFAALYDADQINALYEKELDGMNAYQAGKFERAFSVLSDTATKGLKDSQYLIALMFMKGEGVTKNMLVGLGWFGVAVESGNPDWLRSYNSLYDALTDQQKLMVDEQVRQYMEKYGGKTQGVTCSRRTAVGDRTMKLRCNKVAGTYPEYEIELVP